MNSGHSADWGILDLAEVFLVGLDAEGPQALGQPRLHHGELVRRQGDAAVGVQQVAEGAEGGGGQLFPFQGRGLPGGTCRATHAPTVAAAASCRMRPGTSRIRATRPSPRIVAPEIPSTRL